MLEHGMGTSGVGHYLGASKTRLDRHEVDNPGLTGMLPAGPLPRWTVPENATIVALPQRGDGFCGPVSASPP